MNLLFRVAAGAALLALAAPRLLADSALVQGVLPNGLHYLVLPMDGQERGVSLRLCVEAGSFDETDAELGYAHFIEHMAFDGSTHFPPGAIAQIFQSLGLAWGPDLNANTHENRTVFLLELPQGREEETPKALSVLRDYADGALFDPDQMKREAGVVQSEMRSRQTRDWRGDRSIEKALYATTQLPRREPMGTPASVQAATPESLRAFYRRCYTPSRMTVVMAGTIEPTQAERQIAEAFGSLPSGAPVAPVGMVTPSPGPGIDPWVFRDPDMHSAELHYLVTGPRRPDTPEGRAEEVKERLVISILDHRLLRRREALDNHIGLPQAKCEVEDAAPYLRRDLSIQVNADNLNQAVWALENELKAAREQGFSEVEMKEAIAVELERLRNRAVESATERSKAIADEITDDVAQHRQWRDPDQEQAEAEAACAALTPADLAPVLLDLFPTDRATLVLRCGIDIDESAEDLGKTYREATDRMADVLPPAPEAKLAYTTFGSLGHLLSRSSDEAIGVQTAAFTNGVLLNFKAIRTEPGRFQMRVGLGRGIYDVIPGRAAFPSLAEGLFRSCDLKRQPNSEIAQILLLHGLTYQNSMIDGAESILLEGPSSELPLALKLVTARVTDTDYHEGRLHTAQSYYAAEHEQRDESPASIALYRGMQILSGSDARVVFPSFDEATQITFPTIYMWLRDHWLRGPMEIGIVGDLSWENVQVQVAQTLGTLPRRKTLGQHGEPKRFGRPRHLVETESLHAGSAACALLWPADIENGAAQTAALGLAGDILNDRLRGQLREKLGVTYTPTVIVRRDRFQRDFGFIEAVLSFDPARATELRDKALSIADQLARDGATREEFTRLREPRMAKMRLSLQTPRWWLDTVVSYAQGSPETLPEADGFQVAHEQLTLREVNEALALLAKPKAYSVIVVPQARP